MLLLGGAKPFLDGAGGDLPDGRGKPAIAIIPTMGPARAPGLTPAAADWPPDWPRPAAAAPLWWAGLAVTGPDLGLPDAWAGATPGALFGLATVVIGAAALVYVRERPAGTAAVEPSRGLSWPVEVYRNPLVWLMSFMVFCSGWSQGVFNTFLGTYLSEENGIDLAVVGRLLILIGILSIGSGIVWGRVSDWIGRSLAFLCVFVVQGIGLVLVWLNPIPGAFVIAAVLIGLTHRATFTICAASAGDFVPLHLSSTAFALMSTGAGSGAMLSPSIAGGLADASGSLQGAFAVALGGSLGGALGSAVLYGIMRRSGLR